MTHQSETHHVPNASPTGLSYRTFLQGLINSRYPNLINLERGLFKYKRNCRVRLIEIPRPGGIDHEFKSPEELCDHLGKPEPTPPAPRCRIYIVENLTLEYVAAFGFHLSVDPTVFASQIRTAAWEGQPDENNTPKLLFCKDPDQSFTIRYGELRLFNDHIAGLRLTDNKAGRRIATTNPVDDLFTFFHVGLVRRAISFWCQESYPGCWDGNCPGV